MEPGPERVAHPQAAGLPNQDQERGLKRIVGVSRVSQNAAADAEHHRPVPLDQNGERQLGGLAAVGRKPLKKLAVAQFADGPDVEQGLQLFDDGAHSFRAAWGWFSASGAGGRGYK